MTGRIATMRVAKDFEWLRRTILARGICTKHPLGLRIRREISGTPKGGGKGGRAGQKKRGPGAKRGSEGSGARSVTKGGSSGLWMKRHLQDPYVSAAIEAGAPSRAAFKLVEINDKHRVLSAGDRVVDLGAAPGGWSMVAARIVHARGGRGSQRRGGRPSRGGARGGAPPQLPPPLPEARVEAAEKRGRRGGAVVAVDLLELEAELPGVEAIRGDFRDAVVESKIFACLAARERTPVAPKFSQLQQQQQQQQQQVQQPAAQQCTVMPTAGHTDPTHTSKTSLRERDDDGANSHASDGDDGGRASETADSPGGEEAFLLRGTSASKSLLPRPEQPATDPLGELFVALAAKTPAADTAPAEQEEPDPAPLVGRRGNHNDRDGPLRGEDHSANKPPSPASPPLPLPLPLRPPTRRANVVLSDMAPSFSGDRDTDQARVAGLVLDALAACLGDEGSRRREPLRGATVGGAGRNGGQQGGGAAREGSGSADSPRADGRNVAQGCGAPTAHHRAQARPGSRPVEGAPALYIGEARGGSGNGSSSRGGRGSPTIPESVKAVEAAAAAASGDEPPSDGAAGLLARGGTFLAKFFAGRDEREVKDEAERLFERVKVVKPPASRSGSGEMYLVATGFLLGGRKKRQ